MKKLIRIFWFSLLLLISNLSFSQTVTLTADYGMTNVSGVTNCGGGRQAVDKKGIFVYERNKRPQLSIDKLFKISLN